jgi:hypothetical protein
MENLTALQQNLINGLIKEFTKINPKPNNGATRFGFDTINDCLKEEQRFKDTIAKHNMTMVKLFVLQLTSDVKAFTKEFGKVINVELGYSYPNSADRHHSLENMVEKTTKHPLDNNYSSETQLFFVSKVKKYTRGDSRYNYFEGKEYHNIYVDFKRESVGITLESGKSVQAYKIVGLSYGTHEWLHRDYGDAKFFTSLDELVQSHKFTQQRIVSLAQ